MGKILKKIIINELLRIYEKKTLLHPGQIDVRKNRSIIDAITLLIYKV